MNDLTKFDDNNEALLRKKATLERMKEYREKFAIVRELSKAMIISENGNTPGTVELEKFIMVILYGNM